MADTGEEVCLGGAGVVLGSLLGLVGMAQRVLDLRPETGRPRVLHGVAGGALYSAPKAAIVRREKRNLRMGMEQYIESRFASETRVESKQLQ